MAWLNVGVIKSFSVGASDRALGDDKDSDIGPLSLQRSSNQTLRSCLTTSPSPGRPFLSVSGRARTKSTRAPEAGGPILELPVDNRTVWAGASYKSCCSAPTVLQGRGSFAARAFGLTLQAGGKMQASQKIAGRRGTKEGKGWRVHDKERRKRRLLSQAPLFSYFIRVSFRRLLPVSLECFWKSATASAFLLAWTPCGQLRQTRRKKDWIKKNAHGYFCKVQPQLLIALQVLD